jgi:glycosyltransferase involved in cell wall biosynthesis
MRALVFEQWRGGHYYNYLRCLVPRLAEHASQVIVAMTARAAAAPTFAPALDEFRRARGVTIDDSVPDADPALPAGQRFRLLRHLADAVARHRPDYLMLPSADAQTLALGLLGHVGLRPFGRSLHTAATFHYGYGPAVATRKQALKELAYRTAYAGATWTRLNFVNFLYFEHARARGARWISRAHVVGDPVPQPERLSKREARRMLGVPEDGRYLGLLGSLDVRKAVPELVAGFRAARLGETDRLLLGGRLAPEFQRFLVETAADLIRSGRLIVLDRFLSDGELSQGYSALDVACPLYRDFPGLASLMLKAIAAGRPTVVSDFGWMRAITRRFGVGHTVRLDDPEALGRTLASALDASADYREEEATARLLQFHEVSNFTEAMLADVRQLTGKTTAPEVKCWEWVLEALPRERRALF